MRSYRALLTASLLLACLPGAASAAAPILPSGGLRFGPSTVADLQRAEGSPALAVDRAGALWLSSRTATGGAVVRRSTDGGDSFHATAPFGASAGSDVDVAVDGQGFVYAVAPAGGSGFRVALSRDGGSSWAEESYDAGRPIDARVSIAAGDDAVFVAFGSASGVDVWASPAGSLAFARAGGSSAPGPCGRIAFDLPRATLYVPCAAGSHVELVVGRARPEGISVSTVGVPASPGAGSVAAPLPSVALDSEGTVYAVWADTASRDVYYSALPNGGVAWTAPVQVNGAGGETAVLPAAIGGSGGRLAVAWLGLDADADPNALAPSARWYGFVSLLSGAASGAPTIFQQRFAAKPVHYGRICSSCPGGDPVLGDTLGIGVQPGSGAIAVAYADSTNVQRAAQLFVARQAAGPTPVATSVSRPIPQVAVGDPTGDAAQPQLDLTRVELSQPGPGTLRVRMTVAGLASLAPPAGKTTAVWLTRFQVLSTGPGGASSYATLWVGAESVNAAAPTFVAGTTQCDQPCTRLRYVAGGRPARGSVAGNTITVDVALDGGFGTGIALSGDLFYNVAGVTLGRTDAADDVYAVADETAALDYRLEERIGKTTPGSGRHVIASGAIRSGRASRATFRVDVFENKVGRVVYTDRGAGVSLRSTKIASVRWRGRSAIVRGTALNGRRRVAFVVTITDAGAGGRRDSLAIRAGSYRRSGHLLSGDARIRTAGA